MLQRIWRRPSLATLLALAALFVALGGPAEAGRLIGGREIRDRSITTADLNRGSIRFLRQTPARSVRSAQIADGQVLARDLGSGTVTTASVADGSLLGADLAAGTIGSGQLAAGAVTASKLAAGAVSGATVADGTLQTMDVGSFAGSVQVTDFQAFAPGTCQTAVVGAPVAVAQPEPNIADDVVLVTPPVGWPDPIVVSGVPGANNSLRIIACYVASGGGSLPAPGPTVFRYVTLDTP